MILSILVYDFAITGIRYCQYWRRYIFKDLGRFVVEIKDSKNMGELLGIYKDIRSRIKKKIDMATQVSL